MKIVSFTEQDFVPYEMKTSVIRIYGYEGKQLQGELSNPYFAKSVSFDNALQLLFLLEQLADDLQYPQKTVENRTLAMETFNDWIPQWQNGIGEKKVLATFTLRILFRQNASWQGTLGWKEEGREAQFRSVLELLKLLDSVLTVQ